MRVNVISESAFTVQGHGVHSAFEDTVQSLRKYTDCDVAANTSRRADVVHIHTTGPYALKKLLWDRGAKVVSAHVTPESFVGSLVGAKYWYRLAKVYLRWFYNRADAVLAVSGETAGELKAMGVKRPVYLVPNTIETADFKSSKGAREAARGKFDIGENQFVVMACGQVQPRKGIDVFVEAAREVPQAMFVWVGGIPFKGLAAEQSKMQALMKKHPPNVKFTGLVPRSEVEAWYRAADLFFLPSEQETFGLVIVEAAAAGLPLLLRDLEQYRQTFGGGYECGGNDNFAGLIERFETDKKFYSKWRQASETVAKRYDAHQGAQRLLEVYQAAIQVHSKQTTEARS
jgi:1,2-diacylglycerol-3-alpha-glucose alpha-1,2-galactosyltransferase